MKMCHRSTGMIELIFLLVIILNNNLKCVKNVPQISEFGRQNVFKTLIKIPLQYLYQGHRAILR